MAESRDYKFNWDDLGDVQTGRPNLGMEASVLMYRLMQFSLKDVLAKALGNEEANRLFIRAGELAGREFCHKLLDPTLPFDTFVSELQKKLIELKIGVMRIEQADLEKLTFILTISEDLDCSGLPVLGESVCDFDEGFLAGIFKEYCGREFFVKEIDCWATGDRTCRFRIQPT